MTKIKLTGERSLESKLQRMAWELEADARRVRADHGNDYLADSLQSFSSQIGRLGRSIGDRS